MKKQNLSRKKFSKRVSKNLRKLSKKVGRKVGGRRIKQKKRTKGRKMKKRTRKNRQRGGMEVGGGGGGPAAGAQLIRLRKILPLISQNIHKKDQEMCEKYYNIIRNNLIVVLTLPDNNYLSLDQSRQRFKKDKETPFLLFIKEKLKKKFGQQEGNTVFDDLLDGAVNLAISKQQLTGEDYTKLSSDNYLTNLVAKCAYFEQLQPTERQVEKLKEDLMGLGFESFTDYLTKIGKNSSDNNSWIEWLRFVDISNRETQTNTHLFSKGDLENSSVWQDQILRAKELVTKFTNILGRDESSQQAIKVYMMDGHGRFTQLFLGELSNVVSEDIINKRLRLYITDIDHHTFEWHKIFMPNCLDAGEDEKFILNESIFDFKVDDDYKIVYMNFCGLGTSTQHLLDYLKDVGRRYSENLQNLLVSFSTRNVDTATIEEIQAILDHEVSSRKNFFTFTKK